MGELLYTYVYVHLYEYMTDLIIYTVPHWAQRFSTVLGVQCTVLEAQLEPSGVQHCT